MTHISLPSEFRQVAEWLPKVGAPGDVTVVPGNHDTYIHRRWEDGLGLWSEYMNSDGAAAANQDSDSIFPSLRVRGPLALIGLSSARPSGPLLAVGSLGTQQMLRLKVILANTAARGLCRVLLIHHPPKPRTVVWRKRLTDASALTRLLAQQGVELVLHGHSHHYHRCWIKTPAGPAPAIGVRSASAIGLKPGRRAQYHRYRISTGPRTRSLEVTVREYSPDGHEFHEVDRWSAALPVPGTTY